MTKTQIDNIIHFTFHFNLACDIKQFSPDYIEEKFNYYFGTKPKKITSEQTSILDTDLQFQEWKTTWRCEYIDHLWFIFKINKMYDKPSKLVSIYEECIGDPNMIIDSPYNGLHQVLKDLVEEWLLIDVVANDYKTLMRDIKINNLLKNEKS